MDEKTFHLSDEQMDELLRKWKVKGSNRALAFVFIGSIPLALAAAFFPGGWSSGDIALICATYYCAVCGISQFSF